MTNKEAIAWLNEAIVKLINKLNTYHFTDEDLQSIYHAIKALENEAENE